MRIELIIPARRLYLTEDAADIRHQSPARLPVKHTVVNLLSERIQVNGGMNRRLQRWHPIESQHGGFHVSHHGQQTRIARLILSKIIQKTAPEALKKRKRESLGITIE